MNPFGTTRQAVGGNNYRYEPQRLHWWDVVPFRPCRPPTPDWVIDWPLEVDATKLALFAQAMHCGFGNDLAVAFGNPVILGAPENTVLPPGPLSAPGTTSIQAAPDGYRTWVGRFRQAGAGLRSIAYSPAYRGPAIISELTFGGNANSGGGLLDSYCFGVVPAPGLNQFKVGFSTLPIPAGAILLHDSSNNSDNENPRDPRFICFADFTGSGGSVHIFPNLPINWTSFALFAMMDSVTINATTVDFSITFGSQSAQSQTGAGQSTTGPNQFNALTYFGGAFLPTFG